MYELVLMNGHAQIFQLLEDAVEIGNDSGYDFHVYHPSGNIVATKDDQ